MSSLYPNASAWRHLRSDRSAVDNRVAELRSVLRDDASAPTYIETVPGVGYRFTRSVRRA